MRRSNQLRAKCQVLRELDSVLAKRGARCPVLAVADLGIVPAAPPAEH